MKPKKDNPMSKTDSKRKTVANAAPGRRSTDLTDLLKASRNLSNILDHQELYSAFADIVQEKIPVYPSVSRAANAISKFIDYQACWQS